MIRMLQFQNPQNHWKNHWKNWPRQSAKTKLEANEKNRWPNTIFSIFETYKQCMGCVEHRQTGFCFFHNFFLYLGQKNRLFFTQTHKHAFFVKWFTVNANFILFYFRRFFILFVWFFLIEPITLVSKRWLNQQTNQSNKNQTKRTVHCRVERRRFVWID